MAMVPLLKAPLTDDVSQAGEQVRFSMRQA
jgi:hypothetical protein